MIIIESKRKKIENILKKYPDAVVVDVTSNAGADGMVSLSPFYPHGGIPVPFSDGVTAECVEGVWQGLKVFESEDVDVATFRNRSMKNIKRTVRTHGRVLGHRKGVSGAEILDYVDAKHLIYIPTYKWMLENRASDVVERLKEAARGRTVVLLDYNTSCDVDSRTQPLSHAYLIKAYIEGLYPYNSDAKEDAIPTLPFDDL
ncbi:MAG: hypothetical protein K2M71_07095 [Duncaniella sp.]|nr:hypothetical protein [Duncaniella sp.]